MADKSQQVLDALRQAQEPLPISAISQRLAEKIPERTLQRALQALVESGLIVAIGQNRGRKYQLVQSVSADKVAESGGFLFSPDSLAAIRKVRQPLFTREPCTYKPEWLAEYVPGQSFYLPEAMRKTLLARGQQVSAGLPAGTYAQQIFNRLLIDLSYHSSRLEGNTYSLPDTERLLLAGEAAPDKPDAEKIMLLNHREAIRFLVDGINRLEVSVDNIRSLHYLLADGLVGAGQAGEIREDMVRVSATTYIPMTGAARLAEQLAKVTHTAAQITDPFEQSFFLLVHVSWLQAFIDVNKRTARLACNIPLVRHNLVPLSFNDIAPDDYASAILVVYEQNDVRPLAELYSWSYLRSCKQYAVTAESLGIDPLRVQYRQLRRDLIRTIVQSGWHGETVDRFVAQEVGRQVPEEHQQKVLEDMRIDLAQLAPHSIAGMGITRQELEMWLAERA
ncbi:MAG: Fic family protein [Thiolinea sp.]